MKLICLNTWGARLGEAYFDFISKHAKDTDIFCLQEVWSSRSNSPQRLRQNQTINQLQKTSEILHEFVPVFCPFETNVNNYDGSDPKDTAFGIAAFVKSIYELSSASECFVFLKRNSMIDQDPRTLGRNVQHVQMKIGDKLLNIFNFHGLWNGNGKTDTQERLQQSSKAREYMEKFPGQKILAGDFNLLPDTQSFSLLSAGMRNLISEYGITNTRSSHYKKDVRFADYVLVTRDVKVNRFEVLPDEISDHLALSLDFSV